MDPDSRFAKLRTIFFSLSMVVSVSGLRGSDRDPDVLIGYTDPDSMFRKLGPIFSRGSDLGLVLKEGVIQIRFFRPET